MLFDVENLKMFGSLVVIPAAGWLVKKQLEINEQVKASKAAIEDLTDDCSHTRNRVDAIYDHLISEKQRDRS